MLKVATILRAENLLIITTDGIPVFVFEIKRQVSENLQLVNVSDVMEMFIYCFYLLQMNSKNIATLYCALTDTINYHIFQCALSENGKLKILKKYVIRYPDTLGCLVTMCILKFNVFEDIKLVFITH